MPEEFDPFSEEVAGLLREAGNLLSEAEQIFREEGADTVRSKWPNAYRLESATEHARSILAWADPRIIRKDVAEAVVSSARKARDTIREAVDTGGGSLIDAANDLLNVTAQIEPRLPPSEDEATAAMARLADVQAEIDQMRGRIDHLVSDQESKLTEAQEKWATRSEEAFHKAERDLSEGSATFDQRAMEAQEHIRELEDEISKTAAEIGGTGISIDNQQESKEQTKKAFWWTVTTVALLIAAAVLAVLVGIENSSQTPESVAGKITVALIFAGIAGYTAGVARHHRERAATARRLAIELNAFGPFIAPLEKVDRNDLRSTIVWRFFGPPGLVNQSQDSEPTPGPRILQLIRERREKRRSPDAAKE